MNLTMTILAEAAKPVLSESVISGGDPFHDAVALFLVQATLIVVLSRLLSLGLSFIKVPRVVCEVLTGILLGQTALAKVHVYSEHLFSPSSLALLRTIAEFGLILFFFLIGLELDPAQLVQAPKKSIPISLSGFIVPFLASAGVCKLLYDTYCNPNQLAFAPFVVFTALAMSITGFPVLTRVLAEKKLLKTPLGKTTMEVAKVDDIITWILLIFVIPFIQNTQNYADAAYIFLTLVGFGLIMWFALRPMMTYISNMGTGSESLSQLSVLMTFCLIFFASWFTQAVGANAIFGALLVGLRTPHDHGFAIKLAEKMEDILMIILLPLYFANVGMNADLSLLNTGLDWGLVVLVIAVASTAKILGTSTAASFSGFSWRESSVMGILTNTKGYIGLIVLNMGFYARILDPRIYANLVILMIVTTAFTLPIISYIYPSQMYTQKEGQSSVKSLPMQQVETKDSSETLAETIQRVPSFKEMTFLIYLPNMQTVPAIMSLIELFQKGPRKIAVNALRMVQLTDRESSVMMATEPEEVAKTDAIMSVVCTFGQLNRIHVKPVFAVASKSDFPSTIIKASADSHSNLILLPWQPSESFNAVSGSHNYDSADYETVEKVLEKAHCSAALFIDRGFGLTDKSGAETNQKVVFPFFNGPDDREALSFVSYLVGNPRLDIRIIVLKENENAASESGLEALRGHPSVTIETLLTTYPYDQAIQQGAQLKKTDLYVLGMQHYSGAFKTWIDSTCVSSVTLIQKHHVQKPTSEVEAV